MKLAKYISELLFENDKVIIPGLGAFIGTPQAAKMDSEGQVLSPPKKVITFDSNDKSADNLLARHISKSENITQIATKKSITDFVNETIKELKEGKRVRLADIGIFSMDVKGHILFDAEDDVNYLTDSFGLDEIKPTVIKDTALKPDETKEVKTKKKESAVVEEKSIPEKEDTNNRKKVPVIVWILIFLFPILIFILTLFLVNPVYFNKQSSHIGEKIVHLKESVFPSHSSTKEFDSDIKDSSINDTSKNSQAITDTMATLEKSYSSDLSSTDTKNVNTDETMIVDEAKSETSSGSNNLPLNYYLIAGSFKDKSNATKLVSQLQIKGYDSQIVGLSPSGLHMVCFNGWNTREEAQKELYRIKVEDNAEPWIYKKN